MKNKYDVIVIGSGIGGLMAACMLSFKKKILVIEKNKYFGGYCSSFKRSRYKFEVAVHALMGCSKNQYVYNLLRKYGVLSRIKIVSHKNLFTLIYPKHKFIFPQNNINDYYKILEKQFPSEKQGLACIRNVIKNIHFEIETINKRKKLVKSPYLTKYARTSLKEILDTHIDNNELKSILSYHWVYRGLSPKSLALNSFSIIHHDYLSQGSSYVNNGMSDIVSSIESIIEKNSGTMIADEIASSILVENNKGIGVTTPRGTYYSDSIVSNIDPVSTYKLFDSNDISIQRNLKMYSTLNPSISAFRVYLGLDVDLKSLGINEYEICLNSIYDSEVGYSASLDNDATLAPCSIVIYSNLDKSACGENHSVVTITMLAGYDYWNTFSDDSYVQRKKDIAKTLINRAKSVIPNLDKYIKVIEIATPKTMERYTGNNKGSIYGWSKDALLGVSKFNTFQASIKNVYFSSAWTKIGGGVEGAMRSAERATNLVNCQ